MIGFEAISDQGEGGWGGSFHGPASDKERPGGRPEHRKIRFRTIPVAISDHGATFDFVACRGPFYKVGVSCTREATFGAD